LSEVIVGVSNLPFSVKRRRNGQVDHRNR